MSLVIITDLRRAWEPGGGRIRRRPRRSHRVRQHPCRAARLPRSPGRPGSDPDASGESAAI